MLFVVATIEVAEGKRDDFLTEFRQIVPKVHAEQGCLEYVPTIDLATNIAAQGEPRPNVVTVVEKWESLEDLEAHLVAPHMLDYRAKVRDMVVRTSLQIVEPA